MAIRYTYKGRPVDMDALQMMNEHSVALGNANMNARGDELGKRGTVKRTAEEIARIEAEMKAAAAIQTNEVYAKQPPVETFDASLLEGYSEEAPKEAPKAKRTRARKDEE